MKLRRLFTAAALFVACTATSLQAATYYVSPYGSDYADGSQTRPFQTVQQAASFATAGDTVIIREGVYRETVRPANSGTSGSPITFEAYPGETVTFSGGDPISGWTLHSGNIYKTTAPISKMATKGESQIFINGEMAIEARWPNWEGDISRPNFAIIDSRGYKSPSASYTIDGYPYYWFTLNDTQLTEIANINLENAEIFIVPGVKWYAVSGPLNTGSATGLDDSTSMGVTLQVQNYDDVTFGPQEGNPYYLYGALGLLDTPGEYYIDPSGYLYIMMPGGAHPDSFLVESKVREYAFDLTARNYITVRNVQLYGTTISTENEASPIARRGEDGTRRSTGHRIEGITAKYISHRSDLSVPNPNFAFNNNTGIILNGEDHLIRDSIIYGSSGNGITLVGLNNQAINNIVVACNYMATDGAGVSTGQPNSTSTGTIIRSNTVIDSGRANILARTIIDGEISYNRVAMSTLQTADYGGIYTWGHNANNSVISYNEVSDCYGRGFGASGIYLDDGSRYFWVHHNVVWNTRAGLLLNLQAQVDNLWTDYIEVWNNTLDAHLESLGSVNSNGLGDSSGWWNSTIRNNIFVHGYLYRNATYGQNVIDTTDPQFTDPARLDYTLQSTSPAIDNRWYNSTFHPGLASNEVDAGARESGLPVWTSGVGSNGEPALSSALAPIGPVGLQVAYDSNLDIDLTWEDRATNESGYIIEYVDTASFTETSTAEVIWEPIAHLPPNTTSYKLKSFPIADWHFRVRAPGSPASNEAGLSGYRLATTQMRATLGDDSFGVDSMGQENGVIQNLETGDWISFNNVYFPDSINEFEIDVGGWAFPGGNGGTIRARQGSPTGTVIATVTVPSNLTSNMKLTDTISLSGSETGLHDLYITIEGTQSICNVGTLKFNDTTSTLPSIPANFSGNASQTSASLTWNAVSNALYYIIERQAEGGAYQEVAFLDAPTTSFNDTSLTPNTAYCYRIRARNALGDSPQAYLSLTTDTPSSMNAPTGLSASNPSGQSISLLWTDNASSETGYEIQVSPNGFDDWETAATQGANSSSASVTAPAGGMTVYYRVRATSSTLNSPWSSVASVAVSGGYVPLATVYEGFRDSVNSSELGWGTNQWDFTGGGALEHSSEVLTFGTLPVTGQSAAGGGQTSTANGFGIVYRNLESPMDISGKTVYLSFLLRPESMTWNQWNDIKLKVNHGLSSTSVEIALGAGGDNSGGEAWGYSASGSSITLANDSVTFGVTYLHLVELAETGGNLRMRVWRYSDSANLPSTMPGTSAAQYLGEVSVASKDRQIHNIGYSTYNSRAYLDEIRMGDSFEAVMGGVTTPAASPFEAWQSTEFTSNGLSASDAAPANDYDGDGFSNLLEYAFGMNPRSPDTSAAGLTAGKSGNFLTLSFKLNNAATDTTVIVQESADPTFTNPTTVDTFTPDGSSTTTTQTTTGQRNLSTQGSSFMRVQVQM